MRHEEPSAVQRLLTRRELVRRAAAGTAIAALGGVWVFAGDSLTREARAQTRDDGRPRLPPGQRVVSALEPMGGQQGDPSPGKFRLKVHGLVQTPLTLDYRALLELPEVSLAADVHCVTGWSALGSRWTGARIRDLAERAGVKGSARHVIFEAAFGYTANVRIDHALADDALVTWRLDGKPLARPHGAPVRALVPDLYFWKSPKWLTGIRFVERDEPGYWEVRGYHNHADPWREERHA
jgi:DMSO/TMAO reductase YedYZ molybdopterin-dependent catalytic subunit